MTFKAIVCQRCRRPWVVEARHATVTCPRCACTQESASRSAVWSGDNPQEAEPVLLQLCGGANLLAQARLTHRPAHRLPHDSPVAAAAARGAGIINQSERAQAVAAALCTNQAARHADLLDALQQAGIAADRAEQEVVRMLATDILMEPRAGHYRVLG